MPWATSLSYAVPRLSSALTGRILQAGQADLISDATAVPWPSVLSSRASAGSGAFSTTFAPGRTAPARSPTGETPVSTTATVWLLQAVLDRSASGTPSCASASQGAAVTAGGSAGSGSEAVVVDPPSGFFGSSPTVGSSGGVVVVGGLETSSGGGSSGGVLDGSEAASTGSDGAGLADSVTSASGSASAETRRSSCTNATPSWPRSRAATFAASSSETSRVRAPSCSSRPFVFSRYPLSASSSVVSCRSAASRPTISRTSGSVSANAGTVTPAAATAIAPIRLNISRRLRRDGPGRAADW
nr:hypothetical protein GCM10020092_101430 [Actinoplanes digitatis]